MKPLSLFGIALAVISLSACDPNRTRKGEKPAPGPTPAPKVDTHTPTLPPNNTGGGVEPTTDRQPVIPEPPGRERKTVEYAIKIEGKAGYVRSPYDDKNRPIDVRGLPSGTEVEDPYNQGRTLLVP